jgi:two-component system sensor histidine kinase BaeS
VALDWQAEALSFRADPDKLTQILVNLLSNALKFTPPGGSVRVAAGRAEPVAATIRGAGPAAGQTSAGGTGPAGPQLCLSVTDSGQGIAAADLPHIFERFWRADPSRSRASGGAGIGLTIVAALVQLHGGTITVESSPGQGSRFEIRLPWRA